MIKKQTKTRRKPVDFLIVLMYKAWYNWGYQPNLKNNNSFWKHYTKQKGR